jgi:hypothetical protein
LSGYFDSGSWNLFVSFPSKFSRIMVKFTQVWAFHRGERQYYSGLARDTVYFGKWVQTLSTNVLVTVCWYLPKRLYGALSQKATVCVLCH